MNDKLIIFIGYSDLRVSEVCNNLVCPAPREKLPHAQCNKGRGPQRGGVDLQCISASAYFTKLRGRAS